MNFTLISAMNNVGVEIYLHGGNKSKIHLKTFSIKSFISFSS
jgi:hypothetical protein